MINEQVILSVTQLNNQAKFFLENKFSNVWVEGEISSLRKYSSGHIYFTLKDSSGEISSVLFAHDAQKLAFIPENGQKVILIGGITIYSPRGQFQFKVKSIHISGRGKLWEAYEQLKQKLESEGIFHPSRKKIIPRYPEKIGIITSIDGAVIRDIINIITRRSPHIHIMLRPSLVQGDIAVESLIQGIKDINDYIKELNDDSIEEYHVNGLLVLYNNMLDSLFQSQRFHKGRRLCGRFEWFHLWQGQ